MNNDNFLGLGLLNYAKQSNCQTDLQSQAVMQNQAYNDSAYFNAMNMNANAKAQKNPYKIAKEILERNSSMQVHRITEK